MTNRSVSSAGKHSLGSRSQAEMEPHILKENPKGEPVVRRASEVKDSNAEFNYRAPLLTILKEKEEETPNYPQRGQVLGDRSV